MPSEDDLFTAIIREQNQKERLSVIHDIEWGMKNATADESLFHIDADCPEGEKFRTGFLRGMQHITDNILPKILKEVQKGK